MTDRVYSHLTTTHPPVDDTPPPMPATAFRISNGFAPIADCMAEHLGREEFIQQVLQVFIGEMGFDRARYYEKAFDMAREKEVLVLTAQAPAGETSRHGLPVDFDDSTVAGHGPEQRPVVSDASHYNGDLPWWVTELDLLDRPWVEVPITAGSETIGLIGADWVGRPGDINDDDLTNLRTVGGQVGSHLGLKPIHLMTRYRSHESEDPSAPPDDLVNHAAERLAGLLDAAATAVFAFSWPHQKLTKVHDYVAPQYQAAGDQRGKLAETYRAGKNLTGRAWADETVRHVVSFDSVQEFIGDLVDKESREWHEAVLGDPVKSVMYTVVGGLDRRYLIRFINRASRPELPFLVEAEVLDAVASDLRSDVDAAIATQRSRSLEQMATLSASATDPSELVAQVGDGLAGECVKDFIVLCHQEESAQFGFIEFCGERVGDFTLPRTARWKDDVFYEVAHQAAGYDVRRLSEFTSDGDSSLASALRENGFLSAMTVPISAGQTRGVLVVPMTAAVVARKGKKERLPDGCTWGTVSLLMAYASLIGNSVETRHSAAKSDGARRALGFVGHELRAPLAGLTSAAEMSVNLAKRTVREADLSFERKNFLLARLSEQQNVLNEKALDVSLALANSPVVAQEREGSLQLHFARASISRVVDDAIRDTRTELQLDRNPRRYEFIVSQAVARIPEVVCDPDRLKPVLKNLLRNAVNYSMPPQPRQPMPIRIQGEYQPAWVSLRITNWGLGIPEDKRDLIFEPWVRGDVEDTHKAIRGMGLGLYLARRIVSAHDGEIFFVSEATFSDPERLARGEGYETMFEVRLPRNLAEGTYTHEWSAGGHRTHPPKNE